MEKSTPPKNFNPVPFAYRQEVTLKIDDVNNLGAGVGRIDGWVVIVPYALARETVKAVVYKNHKNYSEADLLEVLEASAERVAPVCPLFGECGGCQYQHLSYEGQLNWKRRQIEGLMKRLGGLDVAVEPTHGSPLQYGYRSKLTPHYEAPRGDKMPIGFIRQGRKSELVDVANCPIASANINRELPHARERLIARAHKLKRGGTILLRDCMDGVIADNAAIVCERVGPYPMHFCAGEFFQNNPSVLPELLDYAVNEAAGLKYLVDAYCGVGVFAIWAHKKFNEIAGIEISSKSIQCAKINASSAGAQNVSFLIGKAEDIFAEIKFPPKDTAMIIDPPRSGCDERFLNQLCAYGPAKIVYVSCAPDTQARDLAILSAAGYEVKKLQPFDMFPQTRHIENVATLIKRP